MVGLADFATNPLSPRSAAVPGPGAYGVRNTFGDPKYPKSGPYKSIGNRNDRPPAASNLDVGPGRYEVKGTIGEGGPKFSFSARAGDAAAGEGSSTPRRRGEDDGSSSATKSKKKIPTPPPELPRQYNMADNPTTPRYSLGAKHNSPRTVEGSEGPGPGQYPATSMFGSNKKAGVTLSSQTGGAQGERESLEKPGPGQYTLERFADKPCAPQNLSMPHTVPQPPERPGPGQYETHHGSIEDRTSLKHPRVSQEALFGARHVDLSAKGRQGPGPGGYDATVGTIADTARRHNKGPSMSARNAPSGELEAIYPKPGPGEYTLPSMFQEKNKGITMSPRREPVAAKLKVPGPGQYTTDDFAARVEKSTKGVRFNGKREFQAEDSPRAAPVNKQPGPGHYNLPGAFDGSKGKGPTMGGREAKSSWASDYANTPGPGTYTKLGQPDNARGPTFYKGHFTA